MRFFKKPVFLSELSQQRLISLVSLLIILIALPLAVFLSQQQQIYRGKALGPEARPTRAKITNLHGGGFSVSWISAEMDDSNQFVETTGWIEYGTDINNLDQIQYDDRARGDQANKESFSTAAHHISFFNLNPNTTYYFKIKSGPSLYGLNVAGDNWVRGGTARKQETPSALELSGNPHPIYGYIKNQAGNIFDGALVYVRVKKDDSDAKSAPLSAVTRANEGWVVDLKNARESDLTGFFNFDNNDRVLIEVQAAEKGTASADFTVDQCSPAPDIILTLPTAPTPTPTAEPAVTSTPSPAASPTPTPRPTATPTPLPPTATPTPIPTQAPNTANLNFQIKFQGISQQRPSKTVKITLKKGEDIAATFENIGVGADQNGVYNGRIMNIPPDTYDVYIKGWSHLQKKFEGITLVEGENNQDFSGSELLAGDANGDNRISIQDIRIAVLDYIPNVVPDSPADFNLNGLVNIQDIRFIIINYLKEGD
jgi:hypothetical protein